MSIISNLKTYTASEARDNLYELIKSAANGLEAYEIKLRGEKSVIMISKDDLESWAETFDILSNKKEIEAIRRAKKLRKTVSHGKLMKSLGIENAD
ncbi:MAG: hypothetical protein UV73_C0003G0061 [Candidatus Gottesmanbacteria bacterium GW2011_GWA2_43_14]|uniref:Antitoxin n=1 Tax=Candidatus Gottesmanbacteria bacterium GW2011_GWA2_43_14 TaxID=1618443 RepID=A0A0G1DKG0_9BACT|nr:MAG: hypothetical protein UV73_C0003G0061 [Candidatus Gottesmanbacteria bacterium GW2011_GWA2_43_14]